jgi:kynurenine/2-aminoadipate aminotransferase
MALLQTDGSNNEGMVFVTSNGSNAIMDGSRQNGKAASQGAPGGGKELRDRRGASSPRVPRPVEHYLSQEGLARQQGTLRSLVGKFQGASDIVPLAAGFPPPHLFPLTHLSVGVCGGLTATPLTLTLPPGSLSDAQQYNSSLLGYKPLLAWALRHVKMLHDPPATHEIIITNGNNHAIELITSLFLDRGDSLIMEEYTYPVLIESIALPKGYRPLAVAMDEEGMVPTALRQVLENAAALEAAGGPPRPKLLYTIPTGHNPTGVTTTLQRRHQIYSLCREFDIWILEDDPYFYLQWRQEDCPEGFSQPGLYGLCSGAADPPAGSYLSMDVDQRVIRADTFSKFLAPGLRLGWVTARKDVVAKIVSALQTHTVGPCSLSQVVVEAALSAWGDDGLDAHLRGVQGEYAKRCFVLCKSAQTHLQGLASWTVPLAGMFVWMRIDESTGVEDVRDVWTELQSAGVIVCPGSVMKTSPDLPLKKDGKIVSCRYIRVSFSSASLNDLNEGMVRLGRVLSSRRSLKEQCLARAGSL